MELLTVYETAALLKVNPETVCRYIASGRLHAVRIGRRVRVRKEAIEALALPITPKEVTPMRETMPLLTTLPGEPPTEQQLQERQQAITDSAALITRMRSRLGDKPLEPSWPIIREAREERSNQV